MNISNLFGINNNWGIDTVLTVVDNMDDGIVYVGKYFEMPFEIKIKKVLFFSDNTINV